MQRLEEIVSQLERRGGPLTSPLALFEEGMPGGRLRQETDQAEQAGGAAGEGG